MNERIKKLNIRKAIAEKSEQKPKVVREVYDALVDVVQDTLKSDRRVRLPGLGIVSIKFKPARPKRKGKNPFTGEMTTFKANPASNKLKFRPAKELKNFVDRLPKVEPKKKRKKH